MVPTPSGGTPPRFRQIHLDFHTSEHIPDVGAGFDPDVFVATLQAAHVDSITLFAKCHHGWSYYPTAVGAPHPNLLRPDLLGEMVAACAAVDIETPAYLSVQWDERTARLRPQWRAMPAENTFPFDVPSDRSTSRQLSPAWHTLCLANEAYRAELVAQAREVASTYPVHGLFLDILLTPGCVCPTCLSRMLAAGLDPELADDRRANDEAVNETFRQELSAVLRAEHPGLRIFYNSGHLHKASQMRYATYTHLEIESLPTGGWGYDHFPLNARYAATLGLPVVAHTGKFHTSWGEFGGFKQPDALDYECAQMAALGVRCLVGDQLHPSGVIDQATYRSIAPAFARIEALEPYLVGAVQVTQVAIVAAEQFHQPESGNHPSDDGAAQMLQELGHPFDVVDAGDALDAYRLVILPDEIPVAGDLARRLASFVADGGTVVASWRSGMDVGAERFVFDMGIARAGEPVGSLPSYVVVRDGTLDAALPDSAFVMYGAAEAVTSTGAAVLADVHPSYFDRSYRAYTSHQHAPVDPRAPAAGAAVTITDRVGYIAYPIFAMYRAMGQPLYKYVIRGLLARLLPDRVVDTDLPSGARVSLTHQPLENRYILHLMYGAPQVRGRAVPDEDTAVRAMEMIEDVPTLGPFEARLHLPIEPRAVRDALSGEVLAWRRDDGGRVCIGVPSLHVHRAIVVE